MDHVEYLTVGILCVLASARLTRLLVHDSITAVIRTRIAHWANTRKHGDHYSYVQSTRDPHWLAELITCPWCTGFWVTTVVAGSAALWHHHTWWWLTVGVFAAAHCASWATAATITPNISDDLD